MITSNDSHKRERWLNLGRFRISNFIHTALLEVKQEFCHSNLRESAQYLLREAALSRRRAAKRNEQNVTNSDRS